MATILIVEDSKTEKEILAEYLSSEGHTIVHASSSEEALTKLQAAKPNAIFLDIVLPGMSGFELCRDLKSEPDTRSIPIVMCSTKSGQMDKFWGMKQGADAYLTKPLDRAEVLETTRKILA